MNAYEKHNDYYIKCSNTFGSAGLNPYYNEWDDISRYGEDTFIIKKDDKHGIIFMDEKIILPADYDDIFCIHQYLNFDSGIHIKGYKLCLNNKVGLLKVTIDHKRHTFSSEIVLNCEYDFMYCGGDVPQLNCLFIFGDGACLRYYNFNTDYASPRYKSLWFDEFSIYLRAYDGEKHYLINIRDDQVIFVENTGSDYWGISPIGSDNFTSIETHKLLLKDKNQWEEFPLVAPISVFPYPRMKSINIANIIKGVNGLGAIDHTGEQLIEPRYDEIKYELLITATDENGEKTSTAIPIGKCNRESTLSKGRDF